MGNLILRATFLYFEVYNKIGWDKNTVVYFCCPSMSKSLKKKISVVAKDTGISENLHFSIHFQVKSLKHCFLHTLTSKSLVRFMYHSDILLYTYITIFIKFGPEIFREKHNFSKFAQNVNLI